MTFCAACGRELLLRRKRVRCRRCGYRFSSEASFCIKCGAPRGYWPLRIRVGAAVLAVLLIVCPTWIIFRIFATNAIPRALGWAEPPRTATLALSVVNVSATQPPDAPLSAVHPPATLTRPLPPTPLPQTASSLPPASRRASTPTANWTYSAPELISPPDGAVFDGAGANILLEWRPVTDSSLAENEWYMISIAYTGRDGKRVEQIGWSKEGRWTVRADWWDEPITSSAGSANARTFQWLVITTLIEGIDPYASPSRTPISPASSIRSFVWN